MLVFAFDRDWTVDVNPHPRHDAVPLDWVRHLAHETEHAVYAIGNQSLAEEAAIPGVVDIVGRHPDAWDDWLGAKQPDGRYERFPKRRERLSLIADLHPDADKYVVVDDLDLGDVDGWEHYHAWEFIPAVEQGDIDPALPWAREPVADGGYPTIAGLIPTGLSDLRSFLKEYDDAPAHELTFADDGAPCTRVFWDIVPVTPTFERPAAAPTVRCIPMPPGADSVTVRVDNIKRLSIIDPPADLFTAGAETREEEATALRRLADTKPEAVRVSSLLTLLDTADASAQQQRDALRALRRLAAVKPEECAPALPILRSLLSTEDVETPAAALATMRMLGDEQPADIAPAVDEIRPYLDAESQPARREATRCVATIAEEYPGDVADTVPALTNVITDDSDGQRFAVYALSCISHEYPHELKPAAEPLSTALLDDSLPDNVRLNASAALGRVVGEYPTVGVDISDDIAALLDADHPKLRNNAVGLLGDIATVHTDVVEPFVEDIAPLLTCEDTYSRINASATLSRVAEDFPESVEHLAPTFRDLRGDDEEIVRKNARWALDYIGADGDALESEESQTEGAK